MSHLAGVPGAVTVVDHGLDAAVRVATGHPRHMLSVGAAQDEDVVAGHEGREEGREAGGGGGGGRGREEGSRHLGISLLGLVVNQNGACEGFAIHVQGGLYRFFWV